MRSSRPLLGVILLVSGSALSVAAELPTVQQGKWILKSKVNGQPHETQICGNPLDKVAAAIAAARETEKLGCRVEVRSPVPRTTSVVVDCPADRSSEDGSRRVRKGSSELTVNSASMQSVMIDLRREGHHETVDAERVGACD